MQSIVCLLSVFSISCRCLSAALSRLEIGVRQISEIKNNAETKIDGYDFKSGSIVIYSIYNIHHNKQLWTDPELFQPERFVSEKNYRFSFLPFGTGERVCIGNHFAMLESQLLLSMIIQKFDIQLTSDKEVEMDLAVSLRPKGGIPVLLKRL